MAGRRYFNIKETVESLIKSHTTPFSTRQLMAMPMRQVTLLCQRLHEELFKAKKCQRVVEVSVPANHNEIALLKEELEIANDRINELEGQVATLEAENVDLYNRA